MRIYNYNETLEQNKRNETIKANSENWQRKQEYKKHLNSLKQELIEIEWELETISKKFRNRKIIKRLTERKNIIERTINGSFQ